MRHETPEDTHDDVSSTRLVDAPNTGADPYHYRLIARALDIALMLRLALTTVWPACASLMASASPTRWLAPVTRIGLFM